MDILNELDALALATIQGWQLKVEPSLKEFGFKVRHLKPRRQPGLGYVANTSLRISQSRLSVRLEYMVHFNRQVRALSGATAVEAYLQAVLYDGATLLAPKNQSLYLGELPMSLPLWTDKLTALTAENGLLCPLKLAAAVDISMRP